MAASPRNHISAWAQAVSKYTGGAIERQGLREESPVSARLDLQAKCDDGGAISNNLGSAIMSQLWTTHPPSWGSIHLKSLDSFDDSFIDPNMFSWQFHVDMLLAVASKEQMAYSTPHLSTFVAFIKVLPTNATPYMRSQRSWQTSSRMNHSCYKAKQAFLYNRHCCETSLFR
jgi:choline dehydrogenase